MPFFTKLTQSEPKGYDDGPLVEQIQALTARIEDLTLRFSGLNQFVGDEMDRARELRLRASNDSVGAKRLRKHAKQIEEAVPTQLEALQAAHPGQDGF